MYNGDRSRKETLVEHGFRLPSALDNRPLKIEEFHNSQNQVIFTSATPSERELELCGGVVVEQIIRPTGLLDPTVSIRKTTGQIEHLVSEIRAIAKNNERVLVTTLTKKMSEDLTDYLSNLGIRVRYLHSEIKSLERVQIIRDLRTGKFDVLIGINLLREGLDIPEVSLVAVLDADKEGFLRSKSSLLQVAGRAARNSKGKVVLYADKMTEAIDCLVQTTKERRKLQKQFNVDHNILPKTINKSVDEIMFSTVVADSQKGTEESTERFYDHSLINDEEKSTILETLRNAMLTSAENLDFEKAAKLRDEIAEIEESIL